MNKRIFAWILLAGFVLLVVNIAFLQFYLTPSVLVYVFIALIYVFVFNMGKRKNNDKEE